MNNAQYFAHRPPSHVTLLRDPWPTDIPLRKALKPKVWPRFFTGQNLGKARSGKSALTQLA